MTAYRERKRLAAAEASASAAVGSDMVATAPVSRSAVAARVARMTGAELLRQMRDLAGIVRHRSHVDQQPGVLLTQLHLGGIERAELGAAGRMDDGASLPANHVLGDFLALRYCLSGRGGTGLFSSIWPTSR
jgi:hypothetical protein